MGPQQLIAHFRLISKLGEGGMGAVWRATDTRLNRDVAIKVLPEAFAHDADRLARFAREAQVLASLNHPNIAAIYGVEEQSLVMELVDGPTLAEHIANGPISLDEALPLIHQLVDALECAHEKGVIHRDLKPANIKVTPDGTLKVLDFGLAKAYLPETGMGDAVTSPTLTMRATALGAVLGTAGYMAPEQARGRTVDKRADIWAFGVVVYEMVSGRPLFVRPTISDTLAAVLKEEPEWDGVPEKLRRLLRLCLVKDPSRRLRDIGDVRALLDEPDAAPAPVAHGSHNALRWTAVLLAAALLTTGVFLWRATRPVPPQPLIRLNVDLGPDATSGANLTVALAPDGRRMVFPVRNNDGRQMLATRTLDDSKIAVLSGTQDGTDPFFSPDGQWIGFFADGMLRKISVNGGATLTLCASVNPRGAAWGDDGNIVTAFNLQGPLWRVADGGGTPQALTKLTPQQSTHRWPQVLPGGEAVLFTASRNLNGHDDADIEVFSLKTGVMKVVQRGGYFGRVTPTGHLLYVHQGTLFGVRFDLKRLEVSGTPTPLVSDLAANPITGGGQFDFSQGPGGAGALAYKAGSANSPNWQIALLDATGKVQPLITTPGVYMLPRYSNDGRKLAFVGGDSIPRIFDLERETITRMTSAGTGGSIAWAPDSKHLVFGGRGPIFWIRSDNAGEPQKLIEGRNNLSAWSFTPDGRWMAYFETSPETGADLMAVPLDMTDPDHPKAGTPQPVLRTRANELLPRISPDGRWVAYRSDESGANEIWVMPFPSGNGARWQVSAGGGLYGFWSKTSRQLFYETTDHRINVVDYRIDGETFVPGKARVWSDRQIFYPGISNLDLAPDGKHFVVLMATETAESGKASPRVTILFNWFDELRRRIP